VAWTGREAGSLQTQQSESLAATHGTQAIYEPRGAHFDFDGAQADFLWPQIVAGGSFALRQKR